MKKREVVAIQDLHDHHSRRPKYLTFSLLRTLVKVLIAAQQASDSISTAQIAVTSNVDAKIHSADGM